MMISNIHSIMAYLEVFEQILDWLVEELISTIAENQLDAWFIICIDFGKSLFSPSAKSEKGLS